MRINRISYCNKFGLDSTEIRNFVTGYFLSIFCFCFENTFHMELICFIIKRYLRRMLSHDQMFILNIKSGISKLEGNLARHG